MRKVRIEACDFCHTPAYTVLVEDSVRVPWTVECTSGYGLFGGGPCCAPLSTDIVEYDVKEEKEETN